MEFEKKYLPVIAFTKENLNPGSEYWESVSKQVQEALENYGCFIARYGNDDTLDLHNAMCRAVEDLFNVPLERKLQNISANKDRFGYYPTNAYLPLFEAFIFGDIIASPEKLEISLTKFGQTEMMDFVAISQAKMQSTVYKMVMKMVFERYKVEKYYQSHVDSMDHHFGVAKYKAPKENESNIGLITHRDKSFVDLLDQNYVKGLEVETTDGDWIAFEPSPSHYFFLAGEALKVWSNGRICAPYHRVIMRGNETKYTIGLATYAHGIVETPAELVDEEHPLKYKPFSNSAYSDEFIKHRYDNPPYTIEDYCGV